MCFIVPRIDPRASHMLSQLYLSFAPSPSLEDSKSSKPSDGRVKRYKRKNVNHQGLYNLFS